MLKPLFRKLLTSRAFSWGFSLLTRTAGTIFMLHRFTLPDLGVRGHEPEQVRRALSFLRQHRYNLISLEEMFRRLQGSEDLTRRVAFTIDDGYVDQSEVGAKIFAEFDCPVTTFVTSGFLDRKLWFWWDHITYVFRNTRSKRIRVMLADQPCEYQLADSEERVKAETDFIHRCKLIGDDEKHRSIHRLAEAANIAIPEQSPAEYAPMSWDQLRSCEKLGMSFGPHTVTHPILSRTSNQQARYEIHESWDRLRAEAAAPVPIFCYPNGQPNDFGEREIREIQNLGLKGAVVGVPGYARTSAFHNATGRYVVQRFELPPDHSQFVQFASGLDLLVQRVKSLFRAQVGSS